MDKHQTAGQMAYKALSDTTKYDALEVGHAMADDIEKHLYESVAEHLNIINEDVFCVVMLVSKDTMIKNLVRRKFYCWPYLPKPRPNQAVFLYSKTQGKIIKRLWVLPSDMVMAELHSLPMVDKRYATMKAWCDAFYKGWTYIKHKGMHGNKYIDHLGKTTDEPGKFFNTDPCYFWNFVRDDQKIDLLSEHEYFLKHREELIQAGCKIPGPDDSESFDFSKIHVPIEQIINTQEALSN